MFPSVFDLAYVNLPCCFVFNRSYKINRLFRKVLSVEIARVVFCGFILGGDLTYAVITPPEQFVVVSRMLVDRKNECTVSGFNELLAIRMPATENSKNEENPWQQEKRTLVSHIDRTADTRNKEGTGIRDCSLTLMDGGKSSKG